MSEATESDLRSALISAQSRLQAIEAGAQRSAADAAIGTALADFDLNPGAAGQLQELLRPGVSVQNDNGRYVAVGPGFVPIRDHVKAELAKEEYQHFLRGSSLSGSPAARSQAAGFSAAREVLPGESLGAAVVRYAQATQKTPGGDPRTDMAQGMGLRKAR